MFVLYTNEKLKIIMKKKNLPKDASDHGALLKTLWILILMIMIALLRSRLVLASLAILISTCSCSTNPYEIDMPEKIEQNISFDTLYNLKYTNYKYDRKIVNVIIDSTVSVKYLDDPIILKIEKDQFDVITKISIIDEHHQIDRSAKVSELLYEINGTVRVLKNKYKLKDQYNNKIYNITLGLKGIKDDNGYIAYGQSSYYMSGSVVYHDGYITKKYKLTK